MTDSTHVPKVVIGLGLLVLPVALFVTEQFGALVVVVVIESLLILVTFRMWLELLRELLP